MAHIYEIYENKKVDGTKDYKVFDENGIETYLKDDHEFISFISKCNDDDIWKMGNKILS